MGIVHGEQTNGKKHKVHKETQIQIWIIIKVAFQIGGERLINLWALGYRARELGKKNRDGALP